MSNETAGQLNRLLMQVLERLADAALLVDGLGATERWSQYRRAIGWATTAVSLGLCEPLWQRYPELKQEASGSPLRATKEARRRAGPSRTLRARRKHAP